MRRLKGTKKQPALSATKEARPSPSRHWLHLVTLSLLLEILGVICLQLKYAVLDLDLWLHLRAGDWILEHHSFPHTDPFSRIATGRPWIAYSWTYEVLLSLAYRWRGLVGMGMLGTLLTLLVACSVYWMLLRLSGRFWLSCLLASAACFAFLFNTMPRPVFVSMILLSVTLTLILEANRTGQVKTLYVLPLIFLLWCNIHIQFVYGLLLVGLLVATHLILRLLARFRACPTWLEPPTLPSFPLVIVLLGSVLASCIGPYWFHLYHVVYSYSQTTVAYRLVTELQPIDFRSSRHYVQLLLTGVAFYAVAWRKRIDIFRLLLLAGCSIVAFRSVRDAWFICIPAVACIADVSAGQVEHQRRRVLPQVAIAFVIVTFTLPLLAPSMEFDTPGLERAVGRYYPVKAADYILRNHLPGPLYNTFRWGDFLIWYLPQYPVAIDGRTDLYGDEIVDRFTLTANGYSYSDDPYFNESRVILLQRNNALVRFLPNDPRFELVHLDEIAAVFRRR